MKQTAVEWLQEALEQTILTHEQEMQTIGLFEQAKAIEKEQLCYFYVKGAEAEVNNPYVTNIEFYNKTFKSE